MGSEKYTIPEISSDHEWLYLTGQVHKLAEMDAGQQQLGTSPNPSRHHSFAQIKPKQVLLVDIFSSWSGPCAAMESHLRRMRLQFVETPDCLALAKACCDDIHDLQPFKSDPRPTFLFWARGRPVALLRGANRPLLTQLIEQEVRIEVKEMPRSEDLQIDFNSHRVIQCQGEMALLDQDEVVHSIGSGSTEMLTSFFQEARHMSKKRTKNSQSEQSLASLSAQANADIDDVTAPGSPPDDPAKHTDGQQPDTEAEGVETEQKASESSPKLEAALLQEILEAKPNKKFSGSGVT